MKRKACALMELTVCLRTQDSLKAVDVSGARCHWRPPPPGPADRALQGELRLPCETPVSVTPRPAGHPQS